MLYHAEPSHLRKDSFLVSGRLGQALPAFYRCKQHNFALEGSMQTLVAEYLHTCLLCGLDV
jgi:hypothetical protein